MKHLTTAALITLASVYAHAGSVGPYTFVTRVQQICDERGRALATETFMLQASYRGSKQTLEEEEAMLDKAKADGHVGITEMWQSSVILRRSSYARDKKTLAKYKSLLIRKSAAEFNKTWAGITGKIWDQTLNVSEESQASDLGFAVCLDTFLTPK